MSRTSVLFQSKDSRHKDTERMINFSWSGERHLIPLSSDFTFVAIIESGQVQLWDVAKLPEKKVDTQSELPTLTFLPHHSVLTATTLSDSTIATASRDALIIWD